MSDDGFALTSPVPVGGRESLDHYPTPRWCVLSLLAQEVFSGGTVLDPSCGEGSILDVLLERGATTLGIECHPHRAYAARARGHKVAINDALLVDWPEADAVVGNPPYSHGLAFARKAVAWARQAPHRSAYLLLRLSFLEPAAGRGAFFAESPPDVLVLPRRPSFDGRGTDSSTSAWFCWPSTSGRPGEGRLVWLPS